MINELYLYSFPKILNNQPSQFKMWHILVLILLPSLLLVENMIGSITIMFVASVLYLLCFIEKNAIIKHMKMVVVFALDFVAVVISMSLILFPELKVVLYSIIGCIISTIVYEIVIVTKIKKRCYSESTKQNRAVYISGGLSGLIGYFIVKIFIKFQSGIELLLISISSMAMLFVVIAVQKLVVYLFTRNKIDTTGTMNR